MTHLYEVHGCRRFVFAGGPEDAFGNFERVAAYCECLKKYGMTLDDNPILCGDYDYETGVNYMRMCLSVQMTILRQESVQRQNSWGTAYRTIFW